MVPLDTPLEIATCRLLEVAVPLLEPFRISGGAMLVRRSLVVEVTDASGAVGYGESAPFEEPFYSEETLSSAAACIVQHLFPRIAGRTFPGLEAAAGALGKAKDAPYVAKLKALTPGKLLDLLHSAEKRGKKAA